MGIDRLIEVKYRESKKLEIPAEYDISYLYAMT
jgi:hypothetical protein